MAKQQTKDSRCIKTNYDRIAINDSFLSQLYNSKPEVGFISNDMEDLFQNLLNYVRKKDYVEYFEAIAFKEMVTMLYCFQERNYKLILIKLSQKFPF